MSQAQTQGATKASMASKTKTAKQGAAKQGSTTVKVRRPAKELMAERKRMFFGAAYMNSVLGGFCRDQEKMVQHAAHLKLGSASQLRQLKMETLRDRLATAVLEKDDGATPFSIRLQ